MAKVLKQNLECCFDCFGRTMIWDNKYDCYQNFCRKYRKFINNNLHKYPKFCKLENIKDNK